jgi:serine/threonine protein kinase
MNTTTHPEPPADDPRVLRATQEYLAELEAGRRPRRAEFVARYPEVADQLPPYLDALDMVHSAAPLLHSTGAGPTVADQPLPPEPLGDFVIVREIGRGGMGVVYEAVQLSLGRRVALKVLPFAAALDAKQLQRFQNEARAAAQLHHTNIVPVYGVGVERGVHYYAMQLIDGQNLADLIAQMASGGRKPPDDSTRSGALRPPLAETGPVESDGGSRPLAMTAAAVAMSTQRATHAADFYRTAARLAAQAAEALEHAHQLGVIHRDVKPANLIVDARGNLWVTDFGLAQFQTRAGLTRTGDLLGTLRYMSPEQAAGEGAPLDPRTDVYSLGATLYELMTLEPMFGGADHQRLLRQILYDEPRPPRAVERTVPPELETIVLKAVSKSPADRYATAQEFADDLRRFLDNVPIRARRPTLVQRARKWGRRHPSVIAAVVVVCLLTAAALSVSTAMVGSAYAREKQHRKEAEERLALAREAVDELIEVSEQELTDRPGMEGVRKRMLESALGYYAKLIEQRRDDPAAQQELRETEERVQKIFDDLVVLQGAGRLYLLYQPAVRDDLQLTEEQGAKVDALLARRDERPGPPGGPNEWRKDFLDQARANDAQLNAILTARQRKRLEQIGLQLKGAGAFHETEVAKELKLTPEQRERIRGIDAGMFPEPGRRGGSPADWLKDMEKRKKAAMDRVLALLTPEQARKWKEMTGEPFTGPMQFGPPFGRGGPMPGGFGGRGGPH